MNNHFNATLKYLYDLQFFGMKLGLENIRKLCESLENPQDHYPSIHVAGTNGKGSTCAVLASIFQSAGYRTGLYTSPHIHHFSERIRINGEMISEKDIVRLADTMKPEIDRLQCTFFEATTAMAFQYFNEQNVDLAIIETGLGGRLDATNILTPEVSVITCVDLDHTEYLGHDKKQIAAEKGGIIKYKIPVITGEPDPDGKTVLTKIAREQKADIYRIDEITDILNAHSTIYGSSFDVIIKLPNNEPRLVQYMVPMIGEHQIRNAVMAILAVLLQKRFSVSDDAIREGLRNVAFKGRMEWLSPNVIMDAAHNPASLQALKKTIRNLFRPVFRKIFIVFGMLSDKDYGQCIDILSGTGDHFFTVTPNNPRALIGKQLAKLLKKKGNSVTDCDTVEEAIAKAKKMLKPDDLLIITGSHYVLSEVTYF
jgi:dihydrofolate synthase / folylpolyglutamate synthase